MYDFQTKTAVICGITARYEQIMKKIEADDFDDGEKEMLLHEIEATLAGLRVYRNNEESALFAIAFDQAIATSESYIELFKQSMETDKICKDLADTIVAIIKKEVK